MGQRTIAVYNEALSEYNILVIKFSAFGDIILITPALKAIRAKFPKAKVSLLTSEAGSEILKHCPYIDEILIYDYKQQSQKPKSILELGSALRRKNLDLVIDLQNNRRSHLLSFLSFASKTVGYNNRKLSFLLNVKVRLPELKLPPVDHQFNLLSAIGIEKEAEPKLELWPQKEDADYIHKLLSSHWAGGAQKLVGINIGASWPTKRLSAQQMAKLCDLLAAKDFRVILTGDESGVETADSVMKMASSQPINACGKTSLNQLACLIKKCACFVTSDSAPLHIAAAMGTKTVAVFGPTDPLRHAPPNKNSKIIKRELECSPCYKASCKELNCVQKIKPEEIAAAVLELMAKK
jgi:lipopolysaccharide heptosyltransferase II